MVQRFRAFAPPPFAPPAAGQHSIVLADSISDVDTDTGGGTGRWHDILEDRYGIVRVNRTYINNSGAGGDMETSVAFVGATTNATVAQSTVQAHSGTHSCAVAPISSTTVVVSPGLDSASNTMRLNMLAGVTYTHSVYVFIPAGVTPSNVGLQFFDSTDNSTFASTLGAVATVNNAWQRLSVTRTVRAGAVQAFLRVNWQSATVGQTIYLDDAMLQRGATLTAYADWKTRSAIAGTNLQANDHPTNDAVDTFAARIAAWVTNGSITATDWLFVEYGTNDRNYASTTSGALTPTTPTTWAAGVSAILTAYNALSPKPKLVWLGIPQAGPLSWVATPPAVWPTDDAVAYGMDAITAPLVNAAGGLFVPLRRNMDVSLVINSGSAQIHPSVPGHTYIAERVAHALEVGG